MIQDIISAAKGVSAAVTLAQKAASLAEHTKNADLIEAIADLRIELANAKLAVARSTDEIAALEVENRKLRERLEKQEMK